MDSLYILSVSHVDYNVQHTVHDAVPQTPHTPNVPSVQDCKLKLMPCLQQNATRWCGMTIRVTSELSHSTTEHHNFCATEIVKCQHFCAVFTAYMYIVICYIICSFCASERWARRSTPCASPRRVRSAFFEARASSVLLCF